MLGSIMYLSTCTRPDMTYAVSTLAQFSINPTPEHFGALKYLFGYVKYTTSKGLLFKCLDTELLIFGDLSTQTGLEITNTENPPPELLSLAMEQRSHGLQNDRQQPPTQARNLSTSLPPWLSKK